jgi:uncharacterized membrane protein
LIFPSYFNASMTQPILRIAHKLFGISFIAFGILQFITQQVIVGRPPAWPASLPGEYIVAYIVGAWLIFNGVTILLDKKVKTYIPTALFILLYCASRNLYGVLWNSDIGISLTCFGKSITLASGLLLVTFTAAHEFNFERTFKPMDNLLVTMSIYCLSFFLFASGIQHFIFSEFVKFLIPAWIPLPMFCVYASGIALALTGFCLAIGLKRELVAQLGSIMIFSWVLILHIPRVFQDTGNISEWTAVFEALAFSSLLFIVGNASSIATVLASNKQYEFVRK